ncbi:terpenoid synthase [Mycena olivaceomarginata]|nr:terpenoid synthase [Mycena olivaceomarginata]
MLAKVLEPAQFRIPDTLRNWSWPRQPNPHYQVCKEESSAWCESFHAFSPKAQKSFNRCDFNLLASLAYPKLNKDGCRVGCDLMNLFFVIDEYSDVADAAGARIQADIIMDGLKNPHIPRPQGEWIGGEVARQFWLNAIQIATPTSQRRFINEFQHYLDSVVQQAQDRTEQYIRGIDEYFEVRRNTIGAKPSFCINAIEMNFPHEVMTNQHIVTMTAACIDMLIIGNDLCSYNVEQARGDDGHNLVTIVMHALDLDLHAALEWISDLHDKLAENFLAAYDQVPDYSDFELNRQVVEYLDGLGNWVRANDSWSFESERYFGKKGAEVEATRTVELLPKVITVLDPVSPEIQIPEV